MDKEINLEKKIKKLDNIVYKVGQSAQTVHMLTKPQVFYDDTHKQALGYQNPFYLKKAQRIKPTLYDGSVISSQHVVIPVIDEEETLILEEVSRSKMLAKQNDPISKEKKINTTPINYVELNQLSKDFGKHFVPQQELSAEQAFWLQTSNPNTEQSDISPVRIEAPSELPKVSLVNTSLKKLKIHLSKFDTVVKKWTTPDAITEGIGDLLNEVTKVQTVFNQMEAAVQQCFVDKQCFEIYKKKLFLDNDRLLHQIMSQDVMLCVMNSTAAFGDSVNLEMKKSESCNQCLDLEAEFIKKKNMVERDVYTKLSNRFARLEKHCISLELNIKLNQQIFQKDKSRENQNALEFSEFFKNNDLKAQLQEKDTTINKLRNHITSLRESDKKDRVKQDMDEIETINIELDHSVVKLLSENELLHKEIEHLKKIYKDQFDSIKKTCVLSKEHCDSLIAQLNSKSMENADLKGQIHEKVLVTTALQNELMRLKGKNVLDNATTLTNATTIALGMFKLDLDPLALRLLKNRDAHIDYLKYTQEQANIIQGIVKQAKAKQPLDNALDFACKHAKRIQALLIYVRDTCPAANKPSEKLIAVTPLNKVKKVRFFEPLTFSSNIHKQVESSKTPDSNTPVLPSTGLKSSTSTSRSQPTGNKKNDRISQTPSSNMKNKVEVQLRRANLSSNIKNRVKDSICDANVKHTMLNANSKLICVKCKQCIFDANHDVCFLDFGNDVNVRSKSKSSKITSTKVVPIKENTSHSVETQNLEIKVYSKRPKQVKSVGSAKKAKIVESRIANNSEPNHSWGSNVDPSLNRSFYPVNGGSQSR
ncbi:hypothetical protein Tco_0511780 [Tanacetum coccineum]